MWYNVLCFCEGGTALLLNGSETMTADSARLISPLRLAYVGDTVW